MNPTRTRSLAPSTRRVDAAVANPAPAIVLRTSSPIWHESLPIRAGFSSGTAAK